MDGELQFKKRMTELSERCFERGVYTFGEFLNPTEIAYAESLKLPVRPRFYGGAEFCERKIICFGSKEELGYEQDFPVSIIKVSPTSPKFARALTHRDFLGSLLGLGIERSKVGDIFTDGKTAYIALFDGLAEFVTENLVKAGPNPVRAEACDGVPESFAPKKEERTVNVSSLRLDGIICRLYNLPRESGAELFKEERVLVNGRACLSCGYSPKEGETVSVRGFGKFVFLGESGVSARGRLFVKIEVYI